MIILQLVLCIAFFLAARTFGFTVEVRFDGTSKRFEVGSGESILEAMERNQIDKKFGISLSQDCRRGSCLSCSAKVQSSMSSLTSDDSLNEVASREMRKNGLVLLCSSFPTSDGLILDIEANELAWKEVQNRLSIDQREAIAKAIRKKSERNKNQFVQALEKEWKSDNRNER